MESLWRKQTQTIKSGEDNKNTLSTDTHRDVIVVGAGLAGILIAYYLKESGKSVLVLEADRIASGQTERTTAKITSQHDVKYTKLIKDMGVETARLYAQANESAIREYERLIKEKDIKCQFHRCAAYLYTTEDEVVLMEEAMAAASFGIDAQTEGEGLNLYRPITDGDYFYKLCRAILKFFDDGVEPFNPEQTLSVIAIRDAIIKGMNLPFGEPVKVE